MAKSVIEGEVYCKVKGSWRCASKSIGTAFGIYRKLNSKYGRSNAVYIKSKGKWYVIEDNMHYIPYDEFNYYDSPNNPYIGLPVAYFDEYGRGPNGSYDGWWRNHFYPSDTYDVSDTYFHTHLVTNPFFAEVSNSDTVTGQRIPYRVIRGTEILNAAVGQTYAVFFDASPTRGYVDKGVMIYTNGSWYELLNASNISASRDWFKVQFTGSSFKFV